MVAHGGDRSAADLPADMRTGDPGGLARRCSAGEFPLLFGTGCVGTGVDFTPPGPMALVYLCGGQSEILFRQAIGRGLRRQGKDRVMVLDVDVANVPDLHRHANARRKLCADMWAPPENVDMR